MDQRAQANGIPFEALVMDDLYGCNNVLRKRLDQANIEYYGDIPANTVVYLHKPKVIYQDQTRKTLETAQDQGETSL